jgi:putative tryptophan/tyrosine transport system substrate-binding protein
LWDLLELLKEIAPGVTRAAVLRDTAIAAGIGQFAIIQSVAPAVGVDVSPVSLRDATEVERAITAFAQSANGGLILTAGPLSAVRRDLIIGLATACGLRQSPLCCRRRIDLVRAKFH